MEKHYQFVDKTSHQMSAALFRATAKYQQKLELKQMLLGRLMEIGTELFAMSAVCSYANACVEKNPNDKSRLDLADYFCAISRRRIAENFQC